MGGSMANRRSQLKDHGFKPASRLCGVCILSPCFHEFPLFDLVYKEMQVILIGNL